jgi:hypothetical protein
MVQEEIDMAGRPIDLDKLRVALRKMSNEQM